MYVSMVKANHSDNSQKTKIEQATLVVFEEDIPEGYSWLGGTIDVTDIVYPCVEYINQLKKCSNTLKLPKLLLHIIAMCGMAKIHTLQDVVPNVTYDDTKKLLHGTFNGTTVTLDLTKQCTVVNIKYLSMMYNQWDGDMIKFGISLSHSDENQFIIDNMDNIADKIYQQYQTTELDLDKFTKMPIFDQFEASFIDRCNSFAGYRTPVGGTTVIRNVETNKVLYIGGLTSELLRDNINDLKYKSGMFHSYVEISLGNIGINLNLTSMKVNMFYNELHNTIKDAITKRNSDGRINKTGDTLSIFDGVEDIDYSKMYPSTGDDKNENDKPVEDNCGISISMDNLKWLLLYIADIVARDSYTSISHALPVYVYKDNNGKLSATFNNMEPTLVGVDEVEKFNKLGLEIGANVSTFAYDKIDLSVGYLARMRKDYQNHTILFDAKYNF